MAVFLFVSPRAVRRWRRLMIVVGAALALAAGVWSAQIGPAAMVVKVAPGKIIVVDPGHGGPDPGCRGGGLVEKDLTLDIARRLAIVCRHAGMKAVLTRTADTDLGDPTLEGWLARKRHDLGQRAALAVPGRTDVFISIHANSFPEPVWHGSQTFYLRGRTRDAALARYVQDALVARLGPNVRREEAGEFLVLEKVKVPGVIVEVGFLSNQEEAALLGSAEYRQRVAEAIFGGVAAFLAAPEVAKPKL